MSELSFITLHTYRQAWIVMRSSGVMSWLSAEYIQHAHIYIYRTRRRSDNCLWNTNFFFFCFFMGSLLFSRSSSSYIKCFLYDGWCTSIVFACQCQAHYAHMHIAQHWHSDSCIGTEYTQPFIRVEFMRFLRCYLYRSILCAILRCIHALTGFAIVGGNSLDADAFLQWSKPMRFVVAVKKQQFCYAALNQCKGANHLWRRHNLFIWTYSAL